MWFRTLFDSLKPKHSRTSHRQARRSAVRRRPAACKLAVEALEDRLVPASLTVSDATIIEGNAGITNAVVLVSLSSPSTKTVTVHHYSTASGTASAGSDYQDVSGNLTFAPGETSKSILVPVIGDLLVEPNETFFVNLQNAKNATIADGQGIVTILDNEPRALSISDVSGLEGNTGTTPFTFTVSLSAAANTPVTVNFAMQDGTAVVGGDYLAASGTLTFAAGETSKAITVSVNGDQLVEPNETFYVNLSSPSNAVIADGQGAGAIVDDEPRSLSINDVSDLEGNSGTTPFTFIVSLSAAPNTPVTVNFATQDGTAIAELDYHTRFGTLTFAPGETSKFITFSVIGDTAAEPDGTFFVNLSGASANALIADGQGVGTIVDDEPRIRIEKTNVSSLEGNLGTTPFPFTVSLWAYGRPATAPVTVNFATQDGTAIAGQDYLAASGTLTFAPGETSKLITVEVIGDTTAEPDGTFFVNLSGASGNALIAQGQAVGAIVNDDPRIINWDGGGGDFNWNNAFNWDTDSLPGPFDDVVIGADFSGITVNYGGGTTSVSSLDSQANLAVFGATFTVNTVSINGDLTINGGSMQVAGGSINGNLTVSGGYLQVWGGLTVTGQFTNDGTVEADFSIAVYGDYTQTAAGGLIVYANNNGAASLYISGTARLDGALSVVADYATTSSVMTFGARIGEFAAIYADGYSSGAHYYLAGAWYEENNLWVSIAFEDVIYESPPPPYVPPPYDPFDPFGEGWSEPVGSDCYCDPSWYEPVDGMLDAGPGPGYCTGGW